MSVFQREKTEGGAGQQGFRLLFALACLIIVLAGMKAAAGILVPIAFSMFLAVLCYPLMAWLTKRRVPGIIALGLTVSLNIGVLAAMLNAAFHLIVRFQRDFRETYVHKLREYVNEAGIWLEAQGVKGAKANAETLFDWKTVTDYIGNQDVMSTVGNALGTTFGTLAFIAVGIGMVIILLIFILMEAQGTQRRIIAVKLAGGPDMSYLLHSASDVQKYLGIKTIVSALTGIMAGGWCWALGLEYPLLWAILAFVFNFIPAIGSTAACIPAVVEALVTGGVGSAVALGFGYGGINFFLDNFVQPALLGRRFGISPLVIIISVIFWGWMWGPVGMFLAVPLTMVVKVLLDNSEEFRWLSVAMSKKKIKGGEVQLSDFDLTLVDDEMLGGGASTEAPPRL
jgi:predicted PurR-regulated permease PerM